MYAFLKRPAWILSHVLIVILVACLIGLGFWQRQRWLDESAKADALAQRAELDAVAVEQVVDPDAAAGEIGEDVRFTKVQVSGVYDTAAEVAIRNRSQGGSPGAWVMTPLVQADGTAVAIVRGWIPYDPAGMPAPFAGAEPPEGEVTVLGNVQLTQEKGSFGATDPAEGELDVLSRVDLDRFEQQLDVPLAPVWVLLDQQLPPQPDGLPQHVDLLTDDPGQNFSYMMQWWIFAAIAVGGYPLVLRMVARSKHRNDQVPVDDPPAPPGSAPAEGVAAAPVPPVDSVRPADPVRPVDADEPVTVTTGQGEPPSTGS